MTETPGRFNLKKIKQEASKQQDISTPKQPDTETSQHSSTGTSEQLEVEASQHPSAQTSKAKSTSKDYQRTTMYLKKKLHKRLQMAAIEHEVDMSDIAEEAIAKYLDGLDT